MITSELLAKAMSYHDYIQLLEKLLKEGKTTGPIQNEEYFEYAKVNLQRMRRLMKTTILTDELVEALRTIKNHFTFLIITEGWCGDAAQNVPIFQRISESSDKFDVKLLLRDENEALMNLYLTNGSKSIPKVICGDTKTLEQKFVWGPRPAELQTQVETLLKEHKSKEEKGLFVQNWYNHDKTISTQHEILKLVQNL